MKKLDARPRALASAGQGGELFRHLSDIARMKAIQKITPAGADRPRQRTIRASEGSADDAGLPSGSGWATSVIRA